MTDDQARFRGLAERAALRGMTLTQTNKGFVLKRNGGGKLGRNRAQFMYPMPGVIKTLKEVSRWLDSWEGNFPKTPPEVNE